MPKNACSVSLGGKSPASNESSSVATIGTRKHGGGGDSGDSKGAKDTEVRD